MAIQARAHGHESASDLANEEGQALQEDYEHLKQKMQATSHRVDKNISLLTTLVTISETKQGIRNSRGIARLTLIATVFLPFGTVTAVLGMQGPFGLDDDGRFWVFWVVVLPVTITVVALSIAGGRFEGLGP